jgi:hypothetical protein
VPGIWCGKTARTRIPPSATTLPVDESARNRHASGASHSL